MDDVLTDAELAAKYRHQALAALQLAREWQEIADDRQKLLEQMLMLIHTKQAMAIALPTGGEA